MKKNKFNGFTLAEVIVSFSLIMIICTCVLFVLRNGYQLIINTEKITTNTLSTMKIMENDIQTLRDSLESGEEVYDPVVEFTLFSGRDSINVQVYEKSITSDDDINLYTLISGKSLPKLPVPVITSLGITIKNGSESFASYKKSDISVTSLTELEQNGVYLTTSYQWYISREGFTMKEYTDDASINYLPTYPDDYEILPREKTETLRTIKDEYMGRHLVLVATPVSTAGKLGDSFVSNSVYISALPLLTKPDLLFHLDAGLLNSDGVIEGTQYLKYWSDFSGKNNNAVQNDENKQPLLEKMDFGILNINNIEYPIKGQQLFFDGIDDALDINISSNSQNGITVFTVVRNFGDKTDSIINGTGSIGSWTLNQTGFTVNVSDNSFTIGEPDILPDDYHNYWYVVGGSVGIPNGESNSFGRYSLNDKIYSLPSITSSNYALRNNNIRIAYDETKYSNMQIAEIIVYQGQLNETDYKKINDYLLNKYKIPFS